MRINSSRVFTMLTRSRAVFSPSLSLLRVVPRRGRKSGGWESVRTTSCKALVYESFGQPENVVTLQEKYPVDAMGSEDVTIEMIASPVNPSDINTIQGVYPLKPPLPGVGGGEGVGVVRETGESVTSVQIGDWVIPAGPGLGTWRSMIVAPAARFIKVDKTMNMDLAATMTVNPTTAYRMMKDFINLQPGDTILQNGGNSGVGVCVSQLAAAWGLHCISIVRDRPNMDDTVTSLKALGASEVVSELFATSHQMRDLMTNYIPPQLAFNCVGGKSSNILLKNLSDKGIMVNYGGMAKQPVTVPVSYLIFKDMKIVGYWNSKWLEKNLHTAVHYSMMEELGQLAKLGQLQAPPTTHHPLSEYRTALTRAMKPYVGSKQIILMN